MAVESALVKAFLSTEIERSGMSVRAASTALGWHPSTLGKALGGDGSVSVETLIEVCGVVGADPVALLARVVEEARRAREATARERAAMAQIDRILSRRFRTKTAL